MTNRFVIILIIVLLLVIIFFRISENFITADSTDKGLVQENIRTGSRTFDDPLFNDVITYKSSLTDTRDTGVYKCLQSCKGNCVEYGVTGTAYCFPN